MIERNAIWTIDGGEPGPGECQVNPGGGWNLTVPGQRQIGMEVTARGVRNGVAYGGRAIVVDCVTRWHDGVEAYTKTILEGLTPIVEVP